MPDGFINLYKEPGPTSHAAVNQVRRLLGMRAVGHMGTLDPAAEGVLPLAVGRATRLIPLVEGTVKVYRAELVLGLATDTDDTSGTAVAAADASVVDREMVSLCLPSFLGQQVQLPPMFSAVKVAGKKLYELARRGQVAEIPPREITVSSLMLTDWRREGHLAIATIEVECLKGTYIRALCRDIGQKLGLPACMGNLLRRQSGPFMEKHSVKMDTLAVDPLLYLVTINTMLADKPRITLPLSDAKRFLQGQRIRVNHGEEDECPVFCGELFLGLGQVGAGILSPTKVMMQEVELPC
ncbi:MAG: tRNA pseudouridine synthase B [Firmicutes bacterium]|nr:tRNA pseudouridine synthase B [Bacillota bacterium]